MKKIHPTSADQKECKSFVKSILITLLLIMINLMVLGQGTTYYFDSGSANAVGSWKTNLDGTGDSPANFNGADDIFIIPDEKTANSGGVWTVANKIVIEGTFTQNSTSTTTAKYWEILSEGTINISGNGGITISNEGTFECSGLINRSNTTENGTLHIGAEASATMKNGGVWHHNEVPGRGIPAMTWEIGSTCRITRTASTATAFEIASLNQEFYNLEWNYNANTGNSVIFEANPPTFKPGGTLTIKNTNNGTFGLANTTTARTWTIENLVIEGGTFFIAGASAGVTAHQLTINGNLSVTGGTFHINRHNSTDNSAAPPVLNIKGNMNFTGGTLGHLFNNYGIINFNGSSTQTYTGTAAFNNAYIRVYVKDGAILHIPSGNYLAGGHNNTAAWSQFNVESGGTLIVGDADGFVNTAYDNSSAKIGAIRMNGTKTYSTEANYVYNAIGAQVTGNGLPATVNNLTAGSQTQLTLSGDVTVSGNFTILSDADGTGSFLDGVNGEHTLTGTSTMQRYIEGAGGWGPSHTAVDWHFLSSPVANQGINGGWTPEGENNDYDFFAWAESGEWLNQKIGTNNITQFNPGQGYLVAYQQTGTKSFTGTLNTGDVPYTLDHSGGSGKDENGWDYVHGWNLLGNPYPSAIDWSEVDHGETSLFEDVFAYVYNRNRTVDGAPSPGYEEIDGSAENAFIPANQGFFVKAKDGAEFTFTNNLRTHGGSFMKSQPADERLVLQLNGNGYADETLIRIREGSKLERDRTDALKLFSMHPGVPQLYSKTANLVRVAINSVPGITEETRFSLGMRIPADGEYILSLQEVTGLFQDERIFIADLEMDVEVEIGTEGSYTFTATPQDDPNRFELYFTPAGDDDTVNITDPGQQTEIRIWQHNNTLHVDNPDTAINLYLYDISGRQIKQFDAPAGQHRFELNLPAGAYFVKSSGESQHETVKIIIQ